MHTGKKLLVVLMSVLMIALMSCATEKPAPTPEQPPQVTTTTTIAGPVPTPVAETTTTTVAPAPVVVELPSVSEIELRNLFGRANSLKTEADEFGIRDVLPTEYKVADAEFAAAKADYDKNMDAAIFSGVDAFPVKAALEKSVSSWEWLLSEGFPLSMQVESDKATDMKFAAMAADASEFAADRIDMSAELLDQADSFADSKEYSLAIPAYKQAARAYESTAEKAKTNAFRQKIFTEGYAKYASTFFQMGEDKVTAEEALWTAGSLEDLQASVDYLKEANSYYAFVVSSGAEFKAIEGKEAALAAKDKALAAKADANTPEEFADAEDVLAEALVNQQKGNQESAYLWFSDAATAFGAAYDATMTLRDSGEAAVAHAEETYASSEMKALDADLADNVYIVEAKSFLGSAKHHMEAVHYQDAVYAANEVLNYASLSDTFVAEAVQKKADAAAAAMATAKAAADPSMLDARTRLAWAEINNLKSDHPAEYKEAAAAMKAADLAYVNQRYDSAKALADEVGTIISDDFQEEVLMHREVAAKKAAANASLSDAYNRIAWAENNVIKGEYPTEYKEAAAAMKGADLAYANGRYDAAKVLADEVSSILSDDFQAKVLSARKAAEAARAAKEAQKEAAETAIADAQNRMAWANENKIKDSHAAEYKVGSGAMVDSFVAYGNGQYATANAWAKLVSTTFSDEFQERAVTDQAMNDARNRMAWAENNGIKTSYPSVYKDASAAMKGAEISYANGRYAPARMLADEVKLALSDEFQNKVTQEMLAKLTAQQPVQPVQQPVQPVQQPSQPVQQPVQPVQQPAQPVQPVQPVQQPVQPVQQPAQPVQQPAQPTAPVTTKSSVTEADLQAALKLQATSDIDKAQAKFDWAKSKNAENNFPEQYYTGAGKLDAAKFAFANSNFRSASAKAIEAVEVLAGVGDFAALPAAYIVRLIPERRDCLWRIAEYPFVYNNPLKWPVLYEANKKTFKDPSNPNLIYPGQVLVIPSIKGEKREGTWDSKKTYSPLAK